MQQDGQFLRRRVNGYMKDGRKETEGVFLVLRRFSLGKGKRREKIEEEGRGRGTYCFVAAIQVKSSWEEGCRCRCECSQIRTGSAKRWVTPTGSNSESGLQIGRGHKGDSKHTSLFCTHTLDCTRWRRFDTAIPVASQSIWGL